MAEAITIMKCKGDYRAMRLAIRGATAIVIECSWGRIRVSKERFLEATRMTARHRKGIIFHWRISNNGWLWPDDWSKDGLRWTLAFKPVEQPIEGAGVNTPATKGQPDNGQ